MSVFITDWANDLYLDLDQASDVSLASLAAWGRAHIGDLNNLLHTDYSIDSTTLEPTDSGGNILGEQEASIYKVLYKIHYWTRQIKNSLGVGGIDILQSAKSDGGELTFINRNQLSLSYIQLRKDTKVELDKLINYYHHGNAKPLQVTGDDEYVKLSSYEIGVNTPRVRGLTSGL